MALAQKQILIAGIGNIFLGDDAFGVEVAQQLAHRPLPEGVRVVDFGIRSYDLAYAILDGYDATVMVDATPRGGAPGTLYLIEPDLDNLDALDSGPVDAHSMNPVAALTLVKTFGGQPRSIYVVGCEPAVLENEDGQIGLSAPVQAAIPGAIEMIESLLTELNHRGHGGGTEERDDDPRRHTKGTFSAI